MEDDELDQLPERKVHLEPAQPRLEAQAPPDDVEDANAIEVGGPLPSIETHVERSRERTRAVIALVIAATWAAVVFYGLVRANDGVEYLDLLHVITPIFTAVLGFYFGSKG